MTVQDSQNVGMSSQNSVQVTLVQLGIKPVRNGNWSKTKAEVHISDHKHTAKALTESFRSKQINVLYNRRHKSHWEYAVYCSLILYIFSEFEPFPKADWINL